MASRRDSWSMATPTSRLRDRVAVILLAVAIAVAIPAHASPAVPAPTQPAAALPVPAPSKCTVEIRPEMELLAGALTQTGWLQTRGPVGDGNEYYRALTAFFLPYRDHRAIQLLINLSGLGFNYELPPSFICHLGPLPGLDLKHEYSEDLVWAAGNRASLEELRLALRDLAAESDFAAFIARWQGSYNEWVGQAAFAGDQAVAWLEDFFGTQAHEYHLILAPAMFPAGGYAASAVSATGERSVFAIIREPGRSISAPEIPAGPQMMSLALHEWGHAFVNPALDIRPKETARLKTLYWRTMRAMKRQGYGSLEVFLAEQVLRGVTSVAAGDLLPDDPGALAEEASYHETYGFYLTRPVIELLREYQAERAYFPTFDSFVTRLLDGLAPFRVIIPPWAVVAAAVLVVAIFWIKLRGALAEYADRRRRWDRRQPWIWK